MTRKEIEDLLSVSLGELANDTPVEEDVPWYSRKIELTRKAASKLQTDCKIDGFRMPYVTYEHLGDKLRGLGEIVEQRPDKGEYTVKINAGIADKNPSIAVVRLMDGNINIAAYAKEGLINQETVKDTINKIKKAFGR